MNTPDKTLSELEEQSINETVESQPPSVEEEPTGTIHTAHLVFQNVFVQKNDLNFVKIIFCNVIGCPILGI